MASDYEKISIYNEEQLGKDRASRMSQVAMYADTAHFVYELLQNADDAGASEIHFVLNEKALTIEHDGAVFSESDVRAISYFGKGKTDITKIGHFGLGFKSVFAYTASPKVYSGNEHFEISQLYTVVESPFPVNLTTSRTRFVLPFDHIEKSPDYIERSKIKSPEVAYQEIAKKLVDLGADALLFTNHLREIKWKTLETEGHYLREDLPVLGVGRQVYIVTENLETYHLVFDTPILWSDEIGTSKEYHPAQLAFSLTDRLEGGGKLVKSNTTNLSVFFPTGYKTHVGFVIQGPYRTTPARDNVPIEDPFNNYLVTRTAKLLVDSLIVLRKNELLDLDVLSLCPLDYDKFKQGTFFNPLYVAFRDAVQTLPLLPTLSNGFVTAAKAKLVRGAGLTKLFDQVRLEQLYEETGLRWLDTDLTTDNYSDLHKFLTGKKVRRYPYNYSKEEWEHEWVIQFYRNLEEVGHKPFLKRPIIRLENDIHVKPFLNAKQNAFLPFENTDNQISDVPFVKGTIVNDEKCKKFLMDIINLSTPDLADYVREVLPKKLDYFDSCPEEVPHNYLGSISQFVEFWKKYPDEISLFRGHAFLRGETAEGHVIWRKPEELYLDDPYLDSGLRAIFSDPTIKLEKSMDCLCEDYKEIDGFTGFAIALGVMSKLEIRKHLATKMQEGIFPKIGQKTGTTVDNDYFINNLTYDKMIGWVSKGSDYYLGKLFLDRNNINLSRAVWMTMCRAESECFEAIYLPNASNKLREKKDSSYLIKQLRQASWVPDIQGTFKKPTDISEPDLPHNFPPDNSNGWLTAIGFGENIRRSTEEYQIQADLVKDIGFSSVEEAREIADLLRVSGMSVEEFGSLTSKNFKAPQPENSVPDPNRRRKGILEKRDNAPTRESVHRERKVQLGVKKETLEAKAYLRAMYKNVDGQLMCQCCQTEPFKVGDLHYFEAIQCIRGLDRHFFENRLVLCPLCAAMYQYVRDTEDDELRQLIMEHDKPDTASSVEIPIELYGQKRILRFVGKHWFDLKTILESNS